MAEQFEKINWAKVTEFLGWGRRGRMIDGLGYMCGGPDSRGKFHRIVIADNGGELNILGLDTEGPAESIPYTHFDSTRPDELISEAALAYRIHLTLQGRFAEIDWMYLVNAHDL